MLATSNQISRFGVALTNDTGGTLGEFTISFTGEQWRRGDDVSPADQIFYDYAVTSLAGDTINTDPIFSSIGSFAAPTVTGPTEVGINGNDPLNQVPRSHTITGLTWAPGATLIIRWTGQDLTGQDDGLAIDGLSFSAAVPEPASFASAIVAGIALFGLRRRR